MEQTARGVVEGWYVELLKDVPNSRFCEIKGGGRPSRGGKQMRLVLPKKEAVIQALIVEIVQMMILTPFSIAMNALI